MIWHQAYGFALAVATFALVFGASAADCIYGAMNAVPKAQLETAEAYGLSGWRKFIRIEWPTMLRLDWPVYTPVYTNEAIFLFHAITLVYFSGFHAFAQKGDALYYANYFADKTFNPFIPYPIVGFYFILLALLVTALYGLVNRRLDRYLPSNEKSRIRLRPQLIR